MSTPPESQIITQHTNGIGMKFSRVILKWSMFASLPFLAACAFGPTQEQSSRANYGRDIPAAECISLAERVVADTFKDPGSTQFRHSPCFKGYWKSIPTLNMGVEFGWIQQGEVNGKNPDGGYVGFRSYKVLIKDGAVIRYCISDKDRICTPTGR
jgi:hypothetical protein